MSKSKRFELYSDDYFVGAYDNVTQEKINVLKSIDLLNSLVEENEQLKSRIAFFEEQEDEFEKYTAQTIQNMIADYRDG